MVTYANISNATTIINRVAAEVGLTPVTDPYSTADAAFTQLTYLLNAAGQELVKMHDWNMLERPATVTTVALDAGNYPLPTDLTAYFHNTFWDTTEDLPLLGPLSPSEWAAVVGGDIVQPAGTYFRVFNNELNLFPQPVTEAKTITYRYVANTWVRADDNITYQREVLTGTDFVLFDDILVVKYLKLKFLIAKSLPATAAQDDFDQIFDLVSAQETPSRDIVIGGNMGYPYINPVTNIRATDFGG